MSLYRVRSGKRFRGAPAGEIVEVEPHRAALVPWCLELVPLDQLPATKAALDGSEGTPPPPVTDPPKE